MEAVQNNSTAPEILDHSNYLRGLLILIGKDKNVWDYELKAFLEESSSMGFDKEFSRNALRDVIRNKYLETDPPLFFNKDLARRFLERGVGIINDGFKIHPDEVKFLESAAYVNGLIEEWNTRYFVKLKSKEEIMAH
jgi:hypothetical protein